MSAHLPTLSLLLAVRNEEAVLDDCLSSIAALDYPPQKLEVFIGDDESDDTSAQIIQRFAARHKNFHYFFFEHRAPAAHNRKAVVLTQLSEKASGEFFLFTDADVCLPPSWAKSQVACLQKDLEIGGLSGITKPFLPTGNSLCTHFQTIDWLAFLCFSALLGRFGYPLTAVGNNMTIRKTAYRLVGGHGALLSNLTEDFALFLALRKSGYKFAINTNRSATVLTRPKASWRTLFRQRKRWLYGIVQCVPHFRLVLWATLLSAFLLPIATFFYPSLTLKILSVPLLVQSIYLAIILNKYKVAKLLLLYPLYVVYIFLFFPLLSFSFIRKKTILWKAQRYT